MWNEDLKELIVNAQRRRFEQMATLYAANPSGYNRRSDLDTAADAYEFVANLDSSDFDEHDFENTPIGKLNEKIDALVVADKEGI